MAHGSFEVSALTSNPDLARAVFEKVHDIKSGPAMPGSPAYFVDIVSALQGAVVAAKAGPLTAIHTTTLRGAGPVIDITIRQAAGVPARQAIDAAKFLLESLGYDLTGVVFQPRPVSQPR